VATAGAQAQAQFQEQSLADVGEAQLAIENATEIIEGLPPADQEAATKALENIKKGSYSAADMNVLGDLFDLNEWQTGQAEQKAADLFGSLSKQTASFATGNVDDEILVAQLYDEAELEGLAADLGVSYEELVGNAELDKPGMTVQDMQARIDNQIEMEFQESERLTALAQDPSLSPAERAEAIKQLKGLGSVDVAALEMDDMTTLASNVDEADVVTLPDGQQMTIADMLNDDLISNDVMEWLDAPEGDFKLKAQEALENKYGTYFKGFLLENQKGLQEALDVTKQAAGQFGQVQETNKENRNTIMSFLNVGGDATKLQDSAGWVDDAFDHGVLHTEGATKGFFAGKGEEALNLDNNQVAAIDRRIKGDGGLSSNYENNKTALQRDTIDDALTIPGGTGIEGGSVLNLLQDFWKLKDVPGMNAETQRLMEELDRNKDGQIDPNWKDVLKNRLGATSLAEIAGGVQVGSLHSLVKTLNTVNDHLPTGLDSSDYDRSGQVQASALDKIGHDFKRLEGQKLSTALVNGIDNQLLSSLGEAHGKERDGNIGHTVDVGAFIKHEMPHVINWMNGTDYSRGYGEGYFYPRIEASMNLLSEKIRDAGSEVERASYQRIKDRMAPIQREFNNRQESSGNAEERARQAKLKAMMDQIRNRKGI
jgi:hypothetical protein